MPRSPRSRLLLRSGADRRAQCLTHVFCCLFLGGSAFAAPPQESLSPLSYADIADLAAPAEVIVEGKVRTLIALKAPSPAPPPDRIRYYAELSASAAIRAPAALPPTLSFLIDLPTTRGAAKQVKGRSLILFGHPGQRPGQFQLLSSTALLPLSPDTDSRVRAVAADVAAADAPPAVTGVAEAFHVAGTVEGESETQIFLSTASERPISLSIIRRPDQAPRFGASLGEIVKENPTLPQRDTLLWYRLACGLPQRLPASALAGIGPREADAARADYAAFLSELGPCNRTRTPSLGNRTSAD